MLRKTAVSELVMELETRTSDVQEAGIGGVDDGVGRRFRWLAHVGRICR